MNTVRGKRLIKLIFVISIALSIFGTILINNIVSNKITKPSYEVSAEMIYTSNSQERNINDVNDGNYYQN